MARALAARGRGGGDRRHPRRPRQGDRRRAARRRRDRRVRPPRRHLRRQLGAGHRRRPSSFLGGLDILVNNAGIEITSLLVDIDPGDVRQHAGGQRAGHRAGHQARLPGDAPRRAGRQPAARSSTSPRSRRRSPSPASPATPRPSPRWTGSPGSPRMESGKLGYGVRVNCVYPGLVPTEMGAKLAQDMATVGLLPERRGRGRGGHRPDAAGPARRGGRHGRRGGVPRLRRREVHHRAGLPVDGGMGM